MNENNLSMLNVSIWEKTRKWELEVIDESVWEAKPILMAITLDKRPKNYGN